MAKVRWTLPGVAAMLAGVSVSCVQSADPPVELGRIAFQRDFATAVEQARAAKKPLFVLFDEIPGCQTCRDFGRGPLSHPLIVAAAEVEFVPVVVANNLPGKDAEVLRRFREPAWNNPVVRFLDANQADVIPRKDGDYSSRFVLSRMAAALKQAGQTVPAYLQLGVQEYAPAKTETATFAMYCYWEGEAKLGQLDGVIGTRIGELQGKEVVEVTFDPTRLEYATLVKQALTMDCAHRVFARTDAQAETARQLAGDKVTRTDTPINDQTQQQYHLAHAPQYHYLPLTALQATRVNAALATRKNPDAWLSPRQLEQKNQLAAMQLPKSVPGLKPNRAARGVGQYAAEFETWLARK